MDNMSFDTSADPLLSLTACDNSQPGYDIPQLTSGLLDTPGSIATHIESPPLDGSFLTLRYLFQLVPEFTNFLKESADPLHGITADLIGARLMGRWKSGACATRWSDAYSPPWLTKRGAQVRRPTSSPFETTRGDGPVTAQPLHVRFEQPGPLPVRRARGADLE